MQDNISIGGIGGEAKGSIYTLYDFKIGDFIFKELDVFVPDIQNLKYTYLLSATMLKNIKFPKIIKEHNENEKEIIQS